ncbi:MAG: NUDIX hydrolase [Bacilli bacterium]|nr:NUDIX hydrolase [Bacilli bacterium]
MYKSEEDFLKDYDPSIYEKLSLTADILLISISDEEKTDYRKNNQKKMSILLVKREEYPYKDKWCLPGGFIDPNKETLEDCANRVLKSETNLENIFLEQLYTFDSINRDPRMRIISTSFIGLIDKSKVTNIINDKAKWFDVTKIEEKNNVVNVDLTNGVDNIKIKVKKELIDKTTSKYKLIGVDNDSIAFDHDIVIVSGIERLKNKINYTDIVFNMMPKYFTLKELQQVYEVILCKKLLDPAFRRIIKDKVEKTDKYETNIGHRPSRLYKYRYNDTSN